VNDEIQKRHDNALLEASYGPIVFETKESVMTDRATLLEKNAALQDRLDAVEKIIVRLETLPQETLYSRGIAYEFRSALEQEQSNE